MDSEDRMKLQIKTLQDQNSQLETDMDVAARDILQLKKQLKKVKSEKSQLTMSLNEVNMDTSSEVIKEERDQIKRRNTELLKELQEKETTIEEMVLKIDELKETEMKYLDACEDKDRLSKQLQDRDNDIDINRVSLDNLQTALDEQQENYDWTISQLEKDKNEAEKQLKGLNSTILELQAKNDTKQVDTTKVDALEEQNEVLAGDLENLIIQKEALSQELESVKDTLKTQELSKGNLVSQSNII